MSLAAPVLPVPDFAAQRLAMCNSQLQPNRVISEAVLQAYNTIAREEFLPPQLQALAYQDEDIALGQGRYVCEPMVHANLVERAAIQKTDRVLDIGGATGYSAAILAQLAAQVYALEASHDLLMHAEKTWAAQGITNIQPILGAHEEGMPNAVPFDVIIINGAVEEIHQGLINQLAPGGRLLCIVAAPVQGEGAPLGKLTQFTMGADGILQQKTFLDYRTPYMKGFEPKAGFKF